MTVSFTLSSLLEGIVSVPKNTAIDVTSLTLDSRAVVAGTLFVALKGTQQHGLAYAEQAEKKGAVAILWESDEVSPNVTLSIPQFEVKALRNKLGLLASRFYGSPSQSLNMIGITGTDGKTSVSHFIAQSVDDCAVIGTIGVGTLDKLQEATHTTPDVLSVHKILADLKNKGVKTVAMEVSSHALDQGRVDNIDFDVAVLTNLNRDHLDYHKTLEAYAEAKEKLFYGDSLKASVLNLDDAFGQKVALHKMAQNRGGVLSYHIENNRSTLDTSENALFVKNATFSSKGISAQIHYGNEIATLSVDVLGRFNLSNLLASLGAMLTLGLPLTDAVARLNGVETVAGRMQKIADSSFLTVVDYAHTPNALKAVLMALREHTTNKLICVFGCGGDRDAGKRPLMATIAEKHADVVIVTDDNPRTESSHDIVRGIMTGFDKPDSVTVEQDRAKAIELSLKQAQNGDVVLIAGKGAEKVQITAAGAMPFDDCEQARTVLQEIAA